MSLIRACRQAVTLLLGLLALATVSPAQAQATPPLIAGAADLQFAIAEIAATFRADTGQEVRLAMGSSGNITRQIEQGSPVELFLSADEAFVFRLAEAGLTRDRGTLYAIGRIVLFTPPGSPIATTGGLEAVRAALEAGRITRFAIANPEHAPYGRAAQQALRASGLWQGIGPRLVLGENVAQAAQFALAGGSQGGIVAYSLVLAPALQGRGAYTLLPETLHEPLRQRMVLLRRAGPVATAFYDYMKQPAAREIMRRYGFALPGE
ncbi:molybdate ABC transporter substrate-binding protein [Falsiroseomonas sp.]|uniref:molybdate ABC transporter substrate-binding protein n=1 Tax=Falsiroseomonas sp. TaxID=2870721 RepID=UPI00272276AA|nr:molybdate ABC transporter substrate-binding protein [Falsiroseomonas sp.]MDO9499638.1 molybdate ABC transporter substrate-binding protein [Falsiroseomonas sp.]